VTTLDGFEWDDAKATSNLRDHGVAFEEAATVFDDPHAIDLADPTPSPERRIDTIGMSAAARVLFVVTTEAAGDRLRIISARPANRVEHRLYAEENEP
jgi:uncharacterized DUF497 family protein